MFDTVYGLRASKLTEIIHNSVSGLNFCYKISITRVDRDFVTFITDEEDEAAAPCVILQHVLQLCGMSSTKFHYN